MHARTLTRPLLAAAALVLVAGLAACGDDDDSASTEDTVSSTADTTASSTDTGADDAAGTNPAGGGTVTAVDFSFDTSGPVAAGSTVSFVNSGEAPHTLTADGGEFDTGRVESAVDASIVAPTEAGDYPFHCEIHPNMTGTLTVE